MEEKEVTTGGQTPKNKLSYEQLEQLCSQLDQQSRALNQRLQETASVITRLEFLFKILENKQCFDSIYIEDVAKEIRDIMTIREPEKVEETQE